MNMRLLIVAGVVLVAAVILFERFIHHIPQVLAVILCSLACVLILTGMILVRRYNP